MTLGGNADNVEHRAHTARAVHADGRTTWRARNPKQSLGYDELHTRDSHWKFLGWDERHERPIARRIKSKEVK